MAGAGLLAAPTALDHTSRVRAVVFDLDGTLVDSAKVIHGILTGIRADHGAAPLLDMAQLRQNLSAGGEALMQHAMHGIGGNLDSQLIEFRRRYAALPTPRDCLYEGTEEALGIFASWGLRMGICTKKPASLARKVISDLALSARFAAISGGDSEVFSKPDPRHLAATLQTMDVGTAETLYVGDSHFDSEMARAAGVRFVFATYGYDTGLVRAQDCHGTVGSLKALVQLVDAGRAKSGC